MSSIMKNGLAVLFTGMLCTFGVSRTFAQTVGTVTTFVSGTAVGATGPDALTLDMNDNSIWVSYTNGADSTGLSGSSTVVQYDTAGNPLKIYTIAGSVDGLKFDPASKKIWAMQNQDGNSTLTVIDPVTGITLASPISYAVPSATRGYDDVVFNGKQVFLSYTNPVNPTDATIQMLTSYTLPLQTKAVLLMDATGTNLANGLTNQPTAQHDPDSLKMLGSGELMLTSGDDGQLIFVKNPGALNQSVAFLQILDSTNTPVSGLDDAVFPVGSQGTFYVSDTSNNQVLAIPVTNIVSGSLFASVGSLNAFVSVNKAGVATPLVSNFNGPHGILFIGN